MRDEREDDDSTSYPNELHPILLYDGVCGLCNRMVQFILKRDRRAAFRFAPLQGPFASRVLKSHGKDPSDLDTIYVVVDGDLADKEKTGAGKPDERLLARSDATVFVMRKLGGIWGAGATVLAWLPRPVRNRGYALIARNRYRIFGRHDTCPVPGKSVRARFLDL